jgi:predicted nucleic acid-binding protein
MPDTFKRVYWDADVFLTYIEGAPQERMLTLDAILDAAQSKHLEIYTSSLSITEVAFARYEQTGRLLDPAIEQQIDALWEDRGVVRIVDPHVLVAREARALIRLAIPKGWSLKSNDAVHIATAMRMRVDEMHTYDKRLHKYAELAGIRILEPYTDQPRLL